jgi:hypothetical protein
MIIAIPNGASRPNGWALPYFLSFSGKTGKLPSSDL